MDFVISCLGCVLVGIILSAPMGPVGMLCVQQTLNHGRRTGLLTGFGAALSDWFYCWVAALSMTLIISFIERHTAAFAIVGGILLAVFSIMMGRRPGQGQALHRGGSPPKGGGDGAATASPPPSGGVGGGSAGRSIGAGFVLAFSNPLIIFLIMPLLMYFGVPAPYYRWWHYIICMLSVMAGAMLWWLMVTWVVDRWRRRMTLRTLHRVNLVMATIMLALAAYSVWRGIRLLLAP